MRFELNPEGVRRLFAIWNVPLPPEETVLFALRGCLPLLPPRAWFVSLPLQTAAVDYAHLRCTVGLWNRRAGKIFAAAGSTVPHRDAVLRAAARRGRSQGRGTNQLEPGYYRDLQPGEHLQGRPSGHAALRQTGYRFYRRSAHAPPYTRRDPLYFGNPYDNLHSAGNLDARTTGFHSAGCVVVAGLPHCPRLADSGPNRGAWKIFHDHVYAAGQKNFPLLLLPAAAAAAALAAEKTPQRLCYGSQGPQVEKLQARLREQGWYRGRIDGVLGVSTYRAWNRAGLSGFGRLLPG